MHVIALIAPGLQPYVVRRWREAAGHQAFCSNKAIKIHLIQRLYTSPTAPAAPAPTPSSPRLEGRTGWTCFRSLTFNPSRPTRTRTKFQPRFCANALVHSHLSRYLTPDALDRSSLSSFPPNGAMLHTPNRLNQAPMPHAPPSSGSSNSLSPKNSVYRVVMLTSVLSGCTMNKNVYGEPGHGLFRNKSF